MEEQRLRKTFDRILQIAEIIPLGLEIITAASEFRVKHDLSPQDAIVYASVISHMSISNAKKCFLNKNSKDFDDPDIVDNLNNYGCKMLPRFDSGHDYIRSQINSISKEA